MYICIKCVYIYVWCIFYHMQCEMLQCCSVDVQTKTSRMTCLMCRVGQNHIYIYIYIYIYTRWIYGVFGREITKHTVYIYIYGQPSCVDRHWSGNCQARAWCLFRCAVSKCAGKTVIGSAVEELCGTRYRSGSFSLMNVGCGFHCLRSFFISIFFFFSNWKCRARCWRTGT